MPYKVNTDIRHLTDDTDDRVIIFLKQAQFKLKIDRIKKSFSRMITGCFMKRS